LPACFEEASETSPFRRKSLPTEREGKGSKPFLRYQKLLRRKKARNLPFRRNPCRGVGVPRSQNPFLVRPLGVAKEAKEGKQRKGSKGREAKEGKQRKGREAKEGREFSTT